jgi:quercetin dioxygenase-like cupin family protein
LVLEGNIEAVLEGETRTLGPGDLLLAPAGAKHTITNQSDKTAKVLAIYPTTTPERVFA